MSRSRIPYWERLPFEPLERIIMDRFTGNPDEQVHPVGEFARCFGYSPGTPKRWRANGLRIEVADRVACQLGLHPASIWPEWFNLEVAS